MNARIPREIKKHFVRFLHRSKSNSFLDMVTSEKIITLNGKPKRFVQKQNREAEKKKILTTDFKTGKGNPLNSKLLFRDERGIYVVQSQEVNEKKSKGCEMTIGEQLLFKRDFKKSDKVWKPNAPQKIGKTANFANEDYIEHGPEKKIGHEKLKKWT